MRRESNLQPVAPVERVVALDAMRGVALLGILLVNTSWFTGYAVLTPEQQAALGTPGIDATVSRWIHVLVDGKFWSLFALLFGASAALQFDRARAQGVEPEGLFLRRAAGLALIGGVHAVFVWFGDILSLYALVAVAVPLFWRASGRVLLGWSVIFLVAPIVQGALWLTIDRLVHDPSVPRVDPGYGPSELLAHFAEGTYARAFAANQAFLIERWYLAVYEGRLFKLLGMFLLGLWAIRCGLVRGVGGNLLRRVFSWGLLVGLPLNMLVVQQAVALRPPSVAGWVVSVLGAVGVPALCLAYAAGLTLWIDTPFGRRCLTVLVPAGRMSLTNYVVHSVVGVSVCYGCGLGCWGRIGSAWSVVFVGLLFGLQVWGSIWWLGTFRHGPLEWVWRCLAYGGPVPLRRGSSRAPERVLQPVRSSAMDKSEP